MGVLTVVVLVCVVLGVKGFYPLFDITARKARGLHVSEVSVDNVESKHVGVDGSVLIHKAYSRMDLRTLRETACALHLQGEFPKAFFEAIQDVFVEVTEHLRRDLRVSAITFVWDGQLSPGKHAKKQERLQKCRKQFDAAFVPGIDEKQARAALEQSLFTTWEMYQAAISVCIALNTSVYVAIGEADVAASLFTMLEYVLIANRMPGEESKILSRTEQLQKWGVPIGNVKAADLERPIEYFYPFPTEKKKNKKTTGRQLAEGSATSNEKKKRESLTPARM